MRFDLLVIGGGPAGAAAALEAARGGVRVCIVERTGFPRHKACGDGLTPRAMRVLEALDIASVPAKPPIESVLVRSAKHSDLDATYVFEGRPGGVVSRFDLDARIVSAATDAGAVLRDFATADALVVEGNRVVGASVRGRSGRIETLRAPVTILAEGSVGALARQSPIRPVRGRTTVFALRRYLQGVHWDGPGRFEIIVPVEVEGRPVAGYAWTFPMAGDRANVGVGLFVGAHSRGHLRDLLDRFEDRLRRNDPRFRKSRPQGEPLGAPVRIGACGARSHAPGVLLVGDAAGLPNPYWAEGISSALESGSLAGRCVVSFLGGESDLEAYGKALALRQPNLDRFAPSLTALYRNLQHHAHDVVPFLGLPGALSAAFFGSMEIEPRAAPSTPPRELGTAAFERTVETVKARALRIAGRDRPVFAEITEQVCRRANRGAPMAALFLTSRSAFPGFDLESRDLRRAATVLELLGMACELLGEVPSQTRTRAGIPEERGGRWLAATLALSIGDRLLARCFALTARLEPPARAAISCALLEVTRELATRALQARATPPAADFARTLACAATRAGAAAAGASESTATRMARVCDRGETWSSVLDELRGMA